MVSQLPWDGTLDAHPHCSHHSTTSFGGESQWLIRWHLGSVDWDWSLPDHSLCFFSSQVHCSSHETTAFCQELITLCFLSSNSVWRLHVVLDMGQLAMRVSRWALLSPLAESSVKNHDLILPLAAGRRAGLVAA